MWGGIIGRLAKLTGPNYHHGGVQKRKIMQIIFTIPGDHFERKWLTEFYTESIFRGELWSYSPSYHLIILIWLTLVDTYLFRWNGW